MFLPNKYTLTYFAIIENAKSKIRNCYLEKHHIIPKSLGGSNSPANLVKLTAREHLICHLLLTKMCDGKSRIKMLQAFNAMWMKTPKHAGRIIKSSRIIAKLREEACIANGKQHLGKKRSAETRAKISAARTGTSSSKKGRSLSENERAAHRKAHEGQKRSEECRQRMRDAAAARGPRKPHSEETKRKIAEGNRGNTRKPHSPEVREKISNSLKGRPAPWRIGVEPASKGKPCPEATKQSLRTMHATKDHYCSLCDEHVSKSVFKRWHKH